MYNTIRALNESSGTITVSLLSSYSVSLIYYDKTMLHPFPKTFNLNPPDRTHSNKKAHAIKHGLRPIWGKIKTESFRKGV